MTRPSSSRASRSRAFIAAAVAAAAAACTFSGERSVRTHLLLQPPDIGLVNSYNLEEQIERGYIPEVLDFFARAGTSIESSRASRVLGQALLERGDSVAAQPHLERAFAKEGRPSLRADTAWLLSQAGYWTDDFATSARWARIAQAEGRRIPDGWVNFLASATKEPMYAAPPGSRIRMGMVFGNPQLIRLPVRVNGGGSEEMVLDSGASISLLTESAAARFGVTPVPGAEASAYGLHQVEIPLRMGWIRSLELGGLTITNVPVGILQDDALAFTTTTAGHFKFAGVLGVHFMKEFDWNLAYTERQVQAVKLEAATHRGSKAQNIFFRRLKPMVRASFNQYPWFLFLLDTGAEPTMVTRTGLTRSKRTADIESAYPMTLEGIGKSRVAWAKISNATVGVDRYMVKFKDLVVKEESQGIQDGVLGSSFLSNFTVSMRFSAMTLTLTNPLERLLREVGPEDGAGEPGGPRRL